MTGKALTATIKPNKVTSNTLDLVKNALRLLYLRTQGVFGVKKHSLLGRRVSVNDQWDEQNVLQATDEGKAMYMANTLHNTTIDKDSDTRVGSFWYKIRKATHDVYVYRHAYIPSSVGQETNFANHTMTAV
uniref:Uncharacterized protein n=1 Tax=Lygus hesperus TaxID=30085 RepID=A0A146LK06_LYGHE